MTIKVCNNLEIGFGARGRFYMLPVFADLVLSADRAEKD